MRLIDKDALKERCITYINGDRYVSEWRIESEPEIDAVPVVRCRDCINYNTDNCCDGLGWCDQWRR